MALRNSSESPILSSSAIVVFPPFGRLVSSEGTTRWPSSSTAYSNLHTHADTTQAILAALSTRGGKAGKSGALGLTLLGAGGTIGVLAETITYRVLSPKTFDAAKAPVVLSAVVLSPLMAVLGARRFGALQGS